ncbi:CDP-alcohol phosphatidyltransferase family protein [Litoreibacter roseus]|uniref:Membrane protein n=1 Tax=Litoreibacter roseus TaxID=2601869 RepID=A0A6N6JFU5_9RHOB|nr:CDP-alcohol phosphatidyltransferase family protein [Litoreibacter roseus]GFE64660.1 membrane protein [Litoreibacter roseus]
MIESDPSHPHRLRLETRPAVSFAAAALVLMVGATGINLWIYSGALLPVGITVAMFACVSGLAVRGIATGYPHAGLGACNIVTLTRASLCAILIGALFQTELQATSSWTLFVIATIAFSMDGLDGWLARRESLVSDFGARFDMEIDALLGATLALLLWQSGKVGPEILALGFMRYAFVAASFVFPWLSAPLPQRFRRKVICVVQIAALIFLMTPIVPDAARLPVSLAATAVLMWSFAIDTLWLARRSK